MCETKQKYERALDAILEAHSLTQAIEVAATALGVDPAEYLEDDDGDYRETDELMDDESLSFGDDDDE